MKVQVKNRSPQRLIANSTGLSIPPVITDSTKSVRGCRRKICEARVDQEPPSSRGYVCSAKAPLHQWTQPSRPMKGPCMSFAQPVNVFPSNHTEA